MSIFGRSTKLENYEVTGEAVNYQLRVKIVGLTEDETGKKFVSYAIPGLGEGTVALGGHIDIACAIRAGVEFGVGKRLLQITDGATKKGKGS